MWICRAAAAKSQSSRALYLRDGKLTEAELHELLAKAGKAHDLDVDLLASVVRQESGGNARAVSRAGAQGLMQLMPGTAAELGVGNAFAPGENISGGTAYLDGLLKRYHDNLALALAAYNAGPAAVDRWHGVPPYRETRIYVARVIHEFNWRIAARKMRSRTCSAANADRNRGTLNFLPKWRHDFEEQALDSVAGSRYRPRGAGAGGAPGIHFDWRVFAEQLKLADWRRIGIGVALIWFGYGMRAVRWSVFLRPTKQVSPLKLVGPR